jgi:hypothetical protein
LTPTIALALGEYRSATVVSPGMLRVVADSASISRRSHTVEGQVILVVYGDQALLA